MTSRLQKSPHRDLLPKKRVIVAECVCKWCGNDSRMSTYEAKRAHELPILRQGYSQESKLAKILRHSLSMESVEQAAPEGKMSLPNFRFGNSSLCAYCGDPADGVDHVIPVSFQSNSKRKARMTLNGPTTYACRHCNSWLGNRGFDSFLERCSCIAADLDRKTRPIEWHKWELDKLGYTLRTYIERDIAKRRWMRYRADWFGSLDFWKNLQSLLWEPSLDFSSPKYNEWMWNYFVSTIKALNEIKAEL